MNKFGKTLASAALLAIAGGLASATPAAAFLDKCKKVQISITNNSGGPIKIYDIDYKDYGSGLMRSENIKNRYIARGGSYSWTRNLEGVNNAKTHIKFQYKKLGSNGRWSGFWYVNTKAKSCKKGKKYHVTLVD